MRNLWGCFRFLTLLCTAPSLEFCPSKTGSEAHKTWSETGDYYKTTTSETYETHYNSEASLAAPVQEQLALGQKPPETMNNCCKSGRSLALVFDSHGQEWLKITHPHNPEVLASQCNIKCIGSAHETKPFCDVCCSCWCSASGLHSWLACVVLQFLLGGLCFPQFHLPRKKSFWKSFPVPSRLV